MAKPNRQAWEDKKPNRIFGRARHPTFEVMVAKHQRLIFAGDRWLRRILDPHQEYNWPSGYFDSYVTDAFNAALYYWTKRFDRIALERRDVWVTRDELRSATQRVSAEFLKAVDNAERNIRAVARRQKPQEWSLEVEPGVRVWQRVRPIETVGCYLPGGRFSLVSTLLMTAIPAQEAGVRNIVIVSPQPGDELLAAADAVALRTTELMGESRSGDVVPLRRDSAA